MYAAGNNDGFAAGGNPFLDCVEVAVDGPYYLFAKRDLAPQGGSNQSVYTPHSSVALVFGYDDKGKEPLGFPASSQHAK